MTRTSSAPLSQNREKDWAPFPGGELEGKRPRALCPDCRARLTSLNGEASRSRTLCFRCYRASLDRDRSIRAAGQIDTASEARFQDALPFEAVNQPRLDMLRMECAAARARARVGAGQFVDRRRQAQIAARHALQRAAVAVKTCGERQRAEAAAIHAAELQLPDAWLPFVVAR